MGDLDPARGVIEAACGAGELLGVTGLFASSGLAFTGEFILFQPVCWSLRGGLPALAGGGI